MIVLSRSGKRTRAKVFQNWKERGSESVEKNLKVLRNLETLSNFIIKILTKKLSNYPRKSPQTTFLPSFILLSPYKSLKYLLFLFFLSFIHARRMHEREKAKNLPPLFASPSKIIFYWFSGWLIQIFFLDLQVFQAIGTFFTFLQILVDSAGNNEALISCYLSPQFTPPGSFKLFSSQFVLKAATLKCGNKVILLLPRHFQSIIVWKNRDFLLQSFKWMRWKVFLRKIGACTVKKVVRIVSSSC